jgi:hypothetical protein
MNEFFKSGIVRKEMIEMQELYEDCLKKSNNLPELSPLERREYMLKVKQLIEKQQLFYARISLSAPDYPELSDFKERVDTLIGIYGFSSIKDGLDHLAKRMDDMLDNPPK